MSTPPDPASPPAATRAADAPATLRGAQPAWLGTLITLSAGLAVVVLGLSLFGLLPRRAPHAVPATKFDAEAAVERLRLPEPAAAAAPVNRLQLPAFPLCAAPRAGARMFRLDLAPDRDAFAVWCASEFVLVDVQLRGDAPVVTRSARFSARGELPGGAAALDLDADGVNDLVLGVAPAAGVTHRAFSGVFWLRGRAAGGFEAPQALVETPSVAVLAADLDAQPGSELVVLTRGDPAAQRAGELFVFSGGVTPKRAAVLPAALAPTDLALGATEPTATELWVVSAQPGAIVRLRLPRDAASWASAARSEVSQRGAQAFVTGPRTGARLFVRDVLGVHALESDPPRLTPFQPEAHVGPAAWLEVERKPAMFGASEHGFTWFEGAAGTARERTLPEGVRVVDASSLGASAPTPRGVLLVTTADEPARLALVVLPAVLRGEASEVTLRTTPVEVPPSAAQVPLE